MRKKKRVNNNDLLLAITLFQNKHPYTEIVNISKEQYIDLVTDTKFDVYVFKTNKNTIKIRVDNVAQKLFS